MCYEVKCNKCGKRSWDGCGRHANAVMSKIPEAEQCKCKPPPYAQDPDTSCTTA